MEHLPFLLNAAPPILPSRAPSAAIHLEPKEELVLVEEAVFFIAVKGRPVSYYKSQIEMSSYLIHSRE